ncbi:sensor domain-containing diguanylate cyclase [Halomonas aquatica]|uniref:Sensor domain-containing diguanylate cyclase n=1 Tax=Halomonas aquatica TaxID=3151123 RepID=A0ABV1NC09_9GAMM
MTQAPGRGMHRQTFAHRHLLFRTGAIAGLSALLFTLIVKVVLILTTAQDMDNLKAREKARVETASGVIENQLDTIGRDTFFLSRTPSVKTAVESRNARRRYRVEELFRAFMNTGEIYFQIRLLDKDGAESARVESMDGQTKAIPKSALQNKSDRYYMQDISRLSSREIYLSPMDLNIENFLIEKPYRPTLRAGTPLFDARGSRQGSLVINFDATHLLDRIRQILGGMSQAMLINQQGDWLVGPEDQEWGFMFGKPGGFAQHHPDAWQKMVDNDSGSLHTKDGLLTFTTVNPSSSPYISASSSGSALAYGRSREVRSDDGYFWKVAALVPSDAMPTANLFATPVRTAVYLLGLIVTLTTSATTPWLFMMRREAQRLARREAHRHRQITANLAEGILVIDQEWCIQEVNSEASRLLGWRRDELLGRDAHQVMPDLWEQSEQFQGVTAAGRPYRSDQETFVRRDGSRLPVDMSAAPLREEDDSSAIVIAFSDITEQLHQEQAIWHLAYHDTLTGLPNRRLLVDRLELAIAACHRHERQMALMFLDLDNFKTINDTHGHETGDALLKDVAERLLQVTRETDVVSRQGGDEFVVLLSELNAPEDAAEVARLLLKRLGPPLTVGDATLRIGASIGVSLYPDDGDCADTLMKAADDAMYRAKQAGRNRYCVSGDMPRVLEDETKTHQSDA